MLYFIFILAFAVLLYFNNGVRNRGIDRYNKLAEKQEALIQMLKEKDVQAADAEEQAAKPTDVV